MNETLTNKGFERFRNSMESEVDLRAGSTAGMQTGREPKKCTIYGGQNLQWPFSLWQGVQIAASGIVAMKPSHEWFDEFVNETSSALARQVRRIAPSDDHVQGIVQEAYLRVFCAVRKAGNDEKCNMAFLFTTARNIAINRSRHQQVVARSLPIVTVAEELRASNRSTERKVAASQKLNSLLLMISSLPPKCREVFVLRMIEGLSHREIGDRLGIAVSTVEKHLARGVRECRKGLKKSHNKSKVAATDAGRAGNGT
jgi:RNA polymerase sigma-70 factor (ECF subfamily)